MKNCALLLASLFLLIAFTGCGSSATEDKADIMWRDLVYSLSDLSQMAKLDTPPSSMISSSDPSGQNNDHSHYTREGPKGWAVIADLTGPGYISHIWMTGFEDVWDYSLRFYLDDSRRPIEMTLKDFFGGKPPFLPPLAQRESGCWYSYVPVPYSRRLVVMAPNLTPNGGKFPLYFQIVYQNLPEGASVQTFPRKFTPEDLAVSESVALSWRNINTNTETPGTATTIILKQNSVTPIEMLTGPAIIEKIEITPDFNAIPSAGQRAQILRDVNIQCAWNDNEFNSVNVPLGDFFGSFWRSTRFKTLLLGMQDSTFYSRLPMPFEKSASIRFQNNSSIDLPLSITLHTKPLTSWPQNLGYLHAAWIKSGPQNVGKPHVLVQTKGKGKYAGCFLSMSHMEHNWWPLESNIYIMRDNEFHPSWRGTGLEDHFNGGWYYSNPVAKPLSGLTYMAPFRTIQYRFHLADTYTFDSSIEALIERGPGNANKVWYESVAYYYLNSPSKAESSPMTPENLAPPPDQLAQITIMKQLVNQERFEDLQGANDHVDAFLEANPEFPEAEMLRLRQIAYLEELNGYAAVADQYRQFATAHNDENILNETKKLMWYHENSANALMLLYCNAQTTVYLDGKALAQVDNPERVFVLPLTLTPGRHVICLQSKATRTLPWVLVNLRTHNGNIRTGLDWKYSETPQGDFHLPGYNDKSWKPVDLFGKGPPEAPFIRTHPHPYVKLEAEATGIRLPGWSVNTPVVIFRKEFVF